VGTGEALNQHIYADRWPPVGVRRHVLHEAAEVIRALHTGRELTHRGIHYTVEQARIYTLPAQPVQIYLSAFGPESAWLAGQIGDGLITTMPDADLVATFRDARAPASQLSRAPERPRLGLIRRV
jgi:G6PDH family F420-dependent oxidoreductase